MKIIRIIHSSIDFWDSLFIIFYLLEFAFKSGKIVFLGLLLCWKVGGMTLASQLDNFIMSLGFFFT